MKILKHNADLALFEKVKSLSDAPNSWRCLYLNLSDQPDLSPGFRTHFIINALADRLAEVDGTIYLCDDGDIFVLFQGALTPIINRLAGHFKDLRPKQPQQPEANSLFTIFDLSRYWDLFFSLCQTKAARMMPGYIGSPPAIPAFR